LIFCSTKAKENTAMEWTAAITYGTTGHSRSAAIIIGARSHAAQATFFRGLIQCRSKWKQCENCEVEQQQPDELLHAISKIQKR